MDEQTTDGCQAHRYIPQTFWPGDKKLQNATKRIQQFTECIRWMDDLRFNVLFNSISVISGQPVRDNERLCKEMEPCLQLKRFLPQAGLKLGTARSAGQHLTHWAAGAPELH